MKISSILAEASRRLRDVTNVPQKEAMLLFSEVTGCELSWLVAHGDDFVDVDELFWQLVKRRESHEPLEYILGRASFYGNSFEVDSRVLIPRPETELLVDKAYELSKDLKEAHIVEIGCGSGVVSVMLAKMLPTAKITAVDISSDALAVSRRNALNMGVSDRITFVHGSYLDGVDERIDMVVSNPPYIANDEKLDIGLSFEPSLALYGGSRGDEMLLHILDLVKERNITRLVCEMGYDQRLYIDEYAKNLGLSVEFYLDLSGLDRGFWLL